MIPESYRTQDACYNCKHCFMMVEYDCDNEYFCTKDGKARPKCGSMAMGEQYDYSLDEGELLDLMEAWNEWQAVRYVEPYGICDSHEYKGK